MQLISKNLSDRMISQHNPLRGLTIARVVSELEAGQRGEYSNLQWLYHFVEKRDATLRGSKRRIISSLMRLDWDIKIQSDLPKEKESLAQRQAEALSASYRSVAKLRDTLRHLALAEFRGFSHVEKHINEQGEVIALEPVPQWHWVRDGIYGDWQFLENALAGGNRGIPIDASRFIIREIDDPINEIALIAFARKGLSSKDFDGFVARYGIPFVFWVLSEAMASAVAAEPSKLAEWMQVMRGIGSDGEGIIPGGSLETLAVTGSGADNNPFLQHLGYQDEQIVMAATSGKLTMLNDATGIGGGASDVHAQTFSEIAQAIAADISETLHEQFDVPELARLFPGQEPLVYFELAAQDGEDVSELVKNVGELERAGWQIDGPELCEKTGYTLTRTAVANAGQALDDSGATVAPLTQHNRNTGLPSATGQTLQAEIEALLVRALAGEDPLAELETDLDLS